MIAVAQRYLAPRAATSKLSRNDDAIKLLRRILTDGRLTYDAAAAQIEQDTGVRITPQTAAKWAKHWGLQRRFRAKTDAQVREALRRLLVAGASIDEARKALREATGVRMGKHTVMRYRKEWGIARKPATAKGAPKTCDLCGQPPLARLYDGAPWAIEGEVCGQCKAELTVEAEAADRKRRRELAEIARRERIRVADAAALAAAKRRAEADRRREALAEARRDEWLSRAAFVRQQAIDLMTGHAPGLRIINRDFTADDLRGPALTHWLKTMLRRDPLALLLVS